MVRELKELPMDGTNPSAFKQPFLVLIFDGDWKSGGQWFVEVDGHIELYIRGEAAASFVNRWSDATDLMRAIGKQFEAHGRPISSVGTYVGSGGPSHVLRNGAFFERAGIDLPSERCNTRERHD